MISGGRKGADLILLKKNVFLGNINAQFSVPFLSKFIRTYDFGAFKGEASHCLPGLPIGKFCNCKLF